MWLCHVATSLNKRKLIDLIPIEMQAGWRYRDFDRDFRGCDNFLQIYKKQMVELGVEDCHLYLRFVQFEFAQGKETGTKPPSVFTNPPKEDPRLDR